MNDVARLWSAGFRAGASFENSVVFDETRLLTRGPALQRRMRPSQGARRRRDLALAGLPLLGAYRPCVAAQAQSRGA